MVLVILGVGFCGLTGFGVVRWGVMAEEVDYTSDGVNERDIFTIGGFSVALDRQGALSRSPLTGRGPRVFSGPGFDAGLVGNDSARPSISRVSSPFFSVGLEGLEADLAFFRTSEGLGVDRPDLAGILGHILSP